MSAITVEVTGTSTRNKGAELMLVAIREHFEDLPSVQLAVDQFFGAYAERARYGLLQKVTLNGWGRSRLAVNLMPREFRRSYGLVREDDVDILLDASGFAFGDQHPPRRTIRFAERVEEASEAGKPVILLPQALGPFHGSEIRDGFARIVKAADLVFARDEVSLEYAREVVGEDETVRRAPDFTNLVRPRLTQDPDHTSRVCIVPNRRMISAAETREEAEEYLPFLERCVRTVRDRSLNPVLLIHGRDDEKLALTLRESVDFHLPQKQERDPVSLKRFLGESHLVIGSRFHALVAALSQGVPAIGTSWSHKYRKLFEEYRCPNMLLPVSAESSQIEESIHRAVDTRRETLVERIRRSGSELEEETRAMWKSVDALIDEYRMAKG